MLSTLRSPLGALLEWLESSRLPHVVIGGIAVGLLAKPRATKDIDGIVWVEDSAWTALVADARQHGFGAREPEPVEFIRQTRMLLLRHDATGVDVDLSLGALPFERAAIERRRLVRLDGLEVPIPTAADLITMKAIAHRPQDLADIQAILRAHPGVDLSGVEELVAQFAEVLEQPELVDDLRRLTRPGQPQR